MNFFLVTPDGRVEGYNHSDESLCHPNFWELSSENVFSKVAKITVISASFENFIFGNKTQVI